MSHPDPSKVRCVSVKNNDWGYFRKEDALNKGWQNSTGFVPEELPNAPTEPILQSHEEPSPEPAQSDPITFIDEATPEKGKPGRKPKAATA